MGIYKDKKAYIVATVFGLSLIIIIPTISLAEKSIHSGVQIGLFKPHMMKSGTHFGVVASVVGSTFTLDSTLKNATTTFTVNVDASTTFKKDGVTDTVSDLSAGQHVVVRGLITASTNTISAKSVNIITHEPTKNGLRHVFKKQK
jgi:hypothetical protein